MDVDWFKLNAVAFIGTEGVVNRCQGNVRGNLDAIAQVNTAKVTPLLIKMFLPK